MNKINTEPKTDQISAHICRLLANLDAQILRTITQDLAAGVLPDLSTSLPTLHTLLTAVAMSQKLPKSPRHLSEEDLPIIDELLQGLSQHDKSTRKARKISLERVVGRAATCSQITITSTLQSLA